MPWWGTATAGRPETKLAGGQGQFGSRLAGLLPVFLLLAACTVEVALDAPSPSDAEAAAAETSEAPPSQPVGDPAWLKDIKAEAPTARPAPGLVPDSTVKAYSGEALTYTDSSKQRGSDEAGKPVEPVDLSDRLLATKVPSKAPSVNTRFAALPNVTGYRLQLATLHNLDAAGKAWRNLVERFPDILGDKRLFVVDLDLGYRGIQHRVEAGPYGTLELAWQACLSLMSRMQGCTVSLP